jgi:NADH:ubiquinone oxidoreductase subunit 2 (subunit N)
MNLLEKSIEDSDNRLKQLRFESEILSKKIAKLMQSGGSILGFILIGYAITLIFSLKSPIFDGIAVLLIALFVFHCVSLIKEYNEEVEAFKAKSKD